MRSLLLVDLGRQSYAGVLAFQRELAKARIDGVVDEDILLLVEHEPVITLGRSSKAAHLLAAPEYLRERGVELFEVERGGDVTFHGPGQLVGYPIIDLKRHRKDLHWYLRQVEQFLIDALATYGLAAERRSPYTGVWIDNRKIASIGVHARDWVTWHGFALNVRTDLAFFDLIVPCGIQAVQMTSIACELRSDSPAVGEVADRVSAAAASLLELVPVPTGPEDLQKRLGATSSGLTSQAGR